MRSVVVGIALAALCGAPSNARAGSIQFQATDLIDVVAGEDLWEYRYSLSGFSFGLDEGFSIYFDSALYKALKEPPPFVSADWDIVTLQPDSNIPSDGIYDALSLVDGPSITNAFRIDFVWLGGATVPSAQRFTINDFDQDGNISFLEEGRTVAPGSIPEPASMLLIATGVAGAVLRRRREHRRNHRSF